MILTGRLSQEEREVHIWLDDVDRKWKAEVSIGKYISKFQKAGWVEVRRDTYKDGSVAVVLFEAPEFAISIRKPTKRKVSEEQIEASRERMKNRWLKSNE